MQVLPKRRRDTPLRNIKKDTVNMIFNFINNGRSIYSFNDKKTKNILPYESAFIETTYVAENICDGTTFETTREKNRIYIRHFV